MRPSVGKLALVLVAALALGGVSVSALPRGFATFFYTAVCPPGWLELPSAKGRLIVSITDTTTAGVTVNAPLSDREDRVHFHNYSTQAVFPGKDVAAIGCCNDQGAENGQYPVNGAFVASTSGYPFTQLLMCVLQADTADPVPFGTVAVFDSDTSACPANWVEYDQAAGRVLVPSYTENGAIANSVPSLASGQDLQHSHSYSTSFATDSVEYVGVAGCCNSNPSEAGQIAIAGQSANVSSGLPYVQLLTCLSQNLTFDSNFPTGALVYNALKCPPGYILSIELSGRLLVALPDSGLAGASYGGPSLDPKASNNPSHNHFFNGTVTTTSAGVGLASGCCAEGYAGNGEYTYSGYADESVIDLPYLMIPLCTQQAVLL